MTPTSGGQLMVRRTLIGLLVTSVIATTAACSGSAADDIATGTTSPTPRATDSVISSPPGTAGATGTPSAESSSLPTTGATSTSGTAKPPLELIINSDETFATVDAQGSVRTVWVDVVNRTDRKVKLDMSLEVSGAPVQVERYLPTLRVLKPIATRGSGTERIHAYDVGQHTFKPGKWHERFWTIVTAVPGDPRGGGYTLVARAGGVASEPVRIRAKGVAVRKGQQCERPDGQTAYCTLTVVADNLAERLSHATLVAELEGAPAGTKLWWSWGRPSDREPGRTATHSFGSSMAPGPQTVELTIEGLPESEVDWRVVIHAEGERPAVPFDGQVVYDL